MGFRHHSRGTPSLGYHLKFGDAGVVLVVLHLGGANGSVPPSDAAVIPTRTDDRRLRHDDVVLVLRLRRFLTLHDNGSIFHLPFPLVQIPLLLIRRDRHLRPPPDVFSGAGYLLPQPLAPLRNQHRVGPHCRRQHVLTESPLVHDLPATVQYHVAAHPLRRRIGQQLAKVFEVLSIALPLLSQYLGPARAFPASLTTDHNAVVLHHGRRLHGLILIEEGAVQEFEVGHLHRVDIVVHAIVPPCSSLPLGNFRIDEFAILVKYQAQFGILIQTDVHRRPLFQNRIFRAQNIVQVLIALKVEDKGTLERPRDFELLLVTDLPRNSAVEGPASIFHCVGVLFVNVVVFNVDSPCCCGGGCFVIVVCSIVIIIVSFSPIIIVSLTPIVVVMVVIVTIQ
mmetsp:Transcript_7726/g.13997  ORF Transcript_7726/g.13997 Transcript_7726/m.13997 type:complete len:394 (+) Transcript_7726:1381-2562(+)